MVRSHRRIVDRSNVHGQRARRRIQVDAAVCRCAVVLHLEGERCVGCAIRVRRRRKFESPRVDVRNRHELSGAYRHTRERECACDWQRPDTHRCQRVRAHGACRIRRIGEAEVCRREGVGRVFEHGHRIARSHRRIVHRNDIDRHRACYRIKIDAAARAAAVVPHLEHEGRVDGAVRVGSRREYQPARVDVRDRDELACHHDGAIVSQGSRARQRGNPDIGQRIRGTVARIGETEVGGGERVCRIFERRHRVVRAHRRIVDRSHIHRQRARRRIHVDPAVGSAAVVLHLEGECCIAGTVAVRRRRKFEIPPGNIRHRDELPGSDRDSGERERACDGNCRDLDRHQRVSACGRRRIGRVGEAEVRRGERVGRVFECRHHMVRADRRIVDRRDIDPHRARGRIQVDAAVGGAAIVLYLEREGCVGHAVGVRRRVERQVAGIDVGD